MSFIGNIWSSWECCIDLILDAPASRGLDPMEVSAEPRYHLATGCLHHVLDQRDVHTRANPIVLHRRKRIEECKPNYGLELCRQRAHRLLTRCHGIRHRQKALQLLVVKHGEAVQVTLIHQSRHGHLLMKELGKQFWVEARKELHVDLQPLVDAARHLLRRQRQRLAVLATSKLRAGARAPSRADPTAAGEQQHGGHDVEDGLHPAAPDRSVRLHGIVRGRRSFRGVHGGQLTGG